MEKKQNRIEQAVSFFAHSIFQMLVGFEWFGDPVNMKCTSRVLTIRSPSSAHRLQILGKRLE